MHFHSEPNFNKLTPQKKIYHKIVRLHTMASHIKCTPIIWGMYQCCHCTPDCTMMYTSFGVWHLADIPLYNGKGFQTFLAFEDGLRCRFRHYNHPFKGWKLVLETVYFESWCTSKQVEKVLKVKLKFRGSKSGCPTDDLLWSSGRPTAILGVRTPGRPLYLHAAPNLLFDNLRNWHHIHSLKLHLCMQYHGWWSYFFNKRLFVNMQRLTVHFISTRVVIFPGKYVYLPDGGKYGKYKISNNGLLVGPVVGVLTCWKLIKLGTKTHYRSK